MTEMSSMYSTVLWPVSSRTKRVMAFMMISFEGLVGEELKGTPWV
jgi:hypothetical protein